MNTANLQLEGVLMAIAALTHALVAKGILSPAEVGSALRDAETAALADPRVTEDLSNANREAIVFPIRLLRLANEMADETGTPSFAELTRMVGERSSDPD